MSDKDYFVMLNQPKNQPVPLMRTDEDIAWYETKEEAEQVASENPLGEHFGFEVFCIGNGE